VICDLKRAGAALLLVVCAASTTAGDASSPSTRLAGELDAAGLARRIAQEKGRVVLVNFWATWCAPCREEFPDLARLSRALSPRGLSVLGVSTDFAKEVPAVEKFLAEHAPPFPNYRKKSGGDDQDFINGVDRSWGGELPFSVLYGRDGKKARVLSGQHSYAQFAREVEKLLR
jgi:thiol-disulfide isomerase/thioredoxin